MTQSLKNASQLIKQLRDVSVDSYLPGTNCYVCLFSKSKNHSKTSNMQLPVHIYKFLSIINVKKSCKVFENHKTVSTNFNL